MTVHEHEKSVGEIVDLRERIAVLERLVRVDGSLARQLSRAMQKNARLRNALEAIKQACVRVCCDVAWFNGITTLYEFCEGVLESTNLDLQEP
jgi:hypothetical protein